MSTTVKVTTRNGTEHVLSLTESEAKFLSLCLNYDSVEEQLGDNYSNGGIDEAMNLFPQHADKRARRQAAGGLLASLTSKGLGSLDTEYDQFCLSELGVRVAFAS